MTFKSNRSHIIEEQGFRQSSLPPRVPALLFANGASISPPAEDTVWVSGESHASVQTGSPSSRPNPAICSAPTTPSTSTVLPDPPHGLETRLARLPRSLPTWSPGSSLSFPPQLLPNAGASPHSCDPTALPTLPAGTMHGIMCCGRSLHHTFFPNLLIWLCQIFSCSTGTLSGI